MNRITASIVLLLSFFINANAQIDFELIVDGQNATFKHLNLLPVLDTTYYEKPHDYQFSISDDSFDFKGTIPYPYLYEFLIDSSHYSNPILIHPGTNRIKIAWSNGEYRIIRLDDHLSDQVIAEYRSWFLNSYDIFTYLRRKKDMFNDSINFHSTQDSLLKNSYHQTDSVIQMYTADFPDAYYGLWYLARLIKFGYNSIHGKSFNNLSDSLKNSYLGKIVSQEIDGYEKVAVGQTIPDETFSSVKGREVTLSKIINPNLITLVNFWYSDCGPCIAKFPHLKELYSAFNHKGFEIIGISTDKLINKSKWLDSVEKYNLPWANLIDFENRSLSIYKVSVFPFNYLVDSDGEILQINISSEELSKFLHEKLI